MKYVVTLKGRTYEVEVEAGEAMILDEYEAMAPQSAPAQSPAPSAPAAPAAEAASQPAPASHGEGTPVVAPLPGNVLSLNVKVGDEVKEGDVLLIIEAMKMENEVVAPQDGTVSAIVVAAGQMVETGEELMII